MQVCRNDIASLASVEPIVLPAITVEPGPIVLNDDPSIAIPAVLFGRSIAAGIGPNIISLDEIARRDAIKPDRNAGRVEADDVGLVVL